jgi:hypothetical protein
MRSGRLTVGFVIVRSPNQEEDRRIVFGLHDEETTTVCQPPTFGIVGQPFVGEPSIV